MLQKLYIQILFERDNLLNTYIEPMLGKPLLKIYQEQRSLLSALSVKNHFEHWKPYHKDGEFHKRYVLHLSFFFLYQEITSSMV